MDSELRRCNLLVISDLHLSEGRNPLLGTFSPREDFFYDGQFSRFLAHYRDTRPGSRPWHLVINGDFADFLQVVTRRGAAPDMARDPDRPCYGLAAGERESAYKMARIARGHERLMRALAGFVATGNTVTIVKGNHDVEFHYPAVRKALVEELRRAWQEERGSGAPGVESIGEDRVRFSDWFYYEKDLLWIEHGSQYERLHAYRYWLSPLLPEIPGYPPARKDEIDLPLGAFFLRYLYNRLEIVQPFGDNMKSPMSFIAWMFRHDPHTAFTFLVRDGGYMLGRIRRSLRKLGPTAYDARKKAHEERLAQLADQCELPPETLARIDALRVRTILQEPAWWVKALSPLLAPLCARSIFFALAASAAATVLLAAATLLAGALPPLPAGWKPVVVTSAVGTLGPWAVAAVFAVAGLLVLRRALGGGRKKRPEKSERLARRARVIARLLGVQYVVMGHAHLAELRKLGHQGGRSLEYFNTGTWTKVFGDERDRLLGDELRFVFLEAVRLEDGLRPRLMQWDDGAGEPRLLELLHN